MSGFVLGWSRKPNRPLVSPFDFRFRVSFPEKNPEWPGVPFSPEPLRFFWARKVAEDLHRVDETANGNAREANEERITEATRGVESLHRKP
jgi:hypothetical protein